MTKIKGVRIKDKRAARFSSSKTLTLIPSISMVAVLHACWGLPGKTAKAQAAHNIFLHRLSSNTMSQTRSLMILAMLNFYIQKWHSDLCEAQTVCHPPVYDLLSSQAIFTACITRSAFKQQIKAGVYSIKNVNLQVLPLFDFTLSESTFL